MNGVDQRRVVSALRRDLLVLVRHHLRQEGLAAAVDLLDARMKENRMEERCVCDNVDLVIVLNDFISFFQMRFGRVPQLTKPISSSSSTSSTAKRTLTRRSQSVANMAAATNNVVDINYGNNVNSNMNKNLEIVGNASFVSSTSPMVSPSFSIPEHYYSHEETRQLAEQLKLHVIDASKINVGFDDIVGHDNIVNYLKQTVIWPQKHPELFVAAGLHLDQATSALLLCGPSGTGKTMLARGLARESGLAFLALSASSLASKWRGDAEKMVRLVFELARHNAPCVVFLDEADSILGQRGHEQEHEASRRLKAEFLIQLDGLLPSPNDKNLINNESIEDAVKKRIFFMAATNLVGSIDDAFLRRFQRIFALNLPSEEQRRDILANHNRVWQFIKEPNHKTKNNDVLDEMARLSEGYSGADLVRVVNEIRRRAFAKAINNKVCNGSKGRLMLDTKELLETLKVIKPSHMLGRLKTS